MANPAGVWHGISVKHDETLSCKHANSEYVAGMAKKTARKPNAAFMKPVTPDAALAAVVGAAPLPRTELTKKLWQYIKKKGLQDKKDKKIINADAALKVVFGGKASVDMFKMTALVSKHLS